MYLRRSVVHNIQKFDINTYCKVKKKTILKMMMNIVKPKDFKTTEVNYSEPKVNSYGGKNVYLNYGEGDGGRSQSLIIKTPLMPIPFGVSKFESDGYVKYTMELSFRNMVSEDEVSSTEKELNKVKKNIRPLLKDEEGNAEEIASLKKQRTELQEKLDTYYLFKTMQHIDDSLVDAGVSNSVAWFKKKKQSRDVTQALLSSNLKYSLDKKTGEVLTQYAPRFKVRIPFKDGRVNCKVWDENKEELEINSQEELEKMFQKGTRVSMLIRCNGVWFASGKFGCSWQAAHMRVVPDKSMTLTSLDASELDVDLVGFSDIKSNSYGSKFAWVNYNNGPFILETPKMSAPFGLSVYVPTDGSGNAKYSVDVSFRNTDDNPNITSLQNFLEGLDEKLVTAGCEHSFEWFKKKKQSRDVTSALLQSNVRYSIDQSTGERLEYAPRMKVKIPCWEGNFRCDFFDDEGNAITDVNEETVKNLITKGSQLSMKIRPSTLWFAGGKFGISWQAVSVTVTKLQTLDDWVDDSDDDIEIDVPSVSDSDDDEEEEVEEEEEEEEEESSDDLEPVVVEPPKPAPKKRRGRKKKTVEATA